MRRPDASCAALLTVAAAFLSPSALDAQTPAPAPAAMVAPALGEPEPEFLNLRLPGRDVHRGVRKVLSELHWHRDLSAAAGEAKQRQQPILWLQMLGNLKGYT